MKHPNILLMSIYISIDMCDLGSMKSIAEVWRLGVLIANFLELIKWQAGGVQIQV